MSSTFDWDAHIASLPTPGVDEMPPPVELSPEQIEEARQAKKKVQRRAWSNRAEQVVMRVLSGAFGAANVKREADRLQGWQDEEGWHYNYANFGKPDITFAVLYQGKLVDGVCEVKSCAPGQNLNVGAGNIKPWQIKSMEKHKGLRLWGLVLWNKDGTPSVYIVEHEHFMVIRKELKARASGNFKGGSLRRKHDLDLLDTCQVAKSNRWYLPDGHWFLCCA